MQLAFVFPEAIVEDEDDSSALVNRLIASEDPSERAMGIAIVEKNAARGEPFSIYTQAKWYRLGFGGYPVDPVREGELLWRAAEGLVPDAVFDIGARINLSTDETAEGEALSFYIVAALMGHWEAMAEVRDALRHGISIAKNENAARIMQKYMSDVVAPYRNGLGLDD
jgi:hypothetical protein